MVKKAHLITGKGGVGKSLFSAVLASHLSLQNQQILLSELTEHSFFRDFLQLPALGYTPTLWKQHKEGRVDVAQWSPEDCLREYALHLFKIESLYRLFFENPVSKSLIQIAPGLHELALLGKLTSSPRRHGPEMNYDQIVVDTFATGHFLSLLRAPAALHESIPFGPMGEQTQSIDDWIRNPDFTQVHIVTIAEELPITETLELYQQLQKEFKIRARVHLNKTSGLTDNDLKGLPEEAAESLQTIINQEKAARQSLLNSRIEFSELPLIPLIEPDVIIQKLTRGL